MCETFSPKKFGIQLLISINISINISRAFVKSRTFCGYLLIRRHLNSDYGLEIILDTSQFFPK